MNRCTKLAAVLMLLTAMAPAAWADGANDAPEVHRLKSIPQGARRAELVRDPEGRGLRYRITWEDGAREEVQPDRFAELLYESHEHRAWLYRILNISRPWSVAWVVLGLLGQVLFTGRMLVQWLVSERQKRSVVPVAFWWMSVTGAAMLMAYFIWRKDIIGVLGQSTGFVIYVRNLWLISREKRSRTVPAPTE